MPRTLASRGARLPEVVAVDVDGQEDDGPYQREDDEVLDQRFVRLGVDLLKLFVGLCEELRLASERFAEAQRAVREVGPGSVMVNDCALDGVLRRDRTRERTFLRLSNRLLDI
jgi:hypothetical protein